MMAKGYRRRVLRRSDQTDGESVVLEIAAGDGYVDDGMMIREESIRW